MAYSRTKISNTYKVQHCIEQKPEDGQRQIKNV